LQPPLVEGAVVVVSAAGASVVSVAGASVVSVAGASVSVAGASVVSVAGASVVSVAADEAVDVAADEAVDVDEAHVVASVGDVVNAVTVKSGVPPTAHVQHGSPKAWPFVMVEPGNVAAHSSALQV
jgi:hypothetical protein